jgi:hypothetical protein
VERIRNPHTVAQYDGASDADPLRTASPSPILKHNPRAVIQVPVSKKGLDILPGFRQGAKGPAIEGILPADARFPDMQHMSARRFPSPLLEVDTSGSLGQNLAYASKPNGL